MSPILSHNIEKDADPIKQDTVFSNLQNIFSCLFSCTIQLWFSKTYKYIVTIFSYDIVWDSQKYFNTSS